MTILLYLEKHHIIEVKLGVIQQFIALIQKETLWIKWFKIVFFFLPIQRQVYLKSIIIILMMHSEWLYKNTIK